MMILEEVRVQWFRNIVDSEPVAIEPDVTCIVGKNESGKTAFLQALHLLNPANEPAEEAEVTTDYPRWRMTRDKRKKDLEDVEFVNAIFSMEEQERQRLEDVLSVPLPVDATVEAGRRYNDQLQVAVQATEEDWLAIARKYAESCSVDLSDFSSVETLEGLRAELNELLASLDGEDDDEEGPIEESQDTAIEQVNDLLGRLDLIDALRGERKDGEVQETIESLVPSFFYFDDYSQLPGRTDLTKFLRKTRKSSRLSEGERTLLSLLEFAGVAGGEFVSGEFEKRIAELEAAANEITHEVFEYWQANQNLQVRFNIDTELKERTNKSSKKQEFLDLRLEDRRYGMTTNFERRSSGFRWFFSFIAAFSAYDTDDNVVILLDEPALGLHGKAQGDILRYIEERLAPTNQVLHTTHSPFMVEMDKVERIRLVKESEGRGRNITGAKLTSDVLSVDEDTLFPVQGALGYDLAQSLFVSQHNLVVEGPSDLLFLQVLSEHLNEIAREGLDDRWTLVPVGGMDKIPTFVALLGRHLEVTVLVDSTGGPNQRLEDLINQDFLAEHRLIEIGNMTEVHGGRADVEDLFKPSEYLRLYNQAFSADLKEGKLSGEDAIIARIEREVGEGFSHFGPANVLLRSQEQFLDNIAETTLSRFEELFGSVNQTLS